MGPTFIQHWGVQERDRNGATDLQATIIVMLLIKHF